MFKTRNPYYLRISDKHVLPLYLYLDDRHVSWMSDHTLQRVLLDLQPKILPKLKAEAGALDSSSTKKPTVETHRAAFGPHSEAKPIDIDEDDNDEKPKPVLSLKYQDFSIYGQCLCVVVEPWPLPRAASAAPSRASVAPIFASSTSTRQPSVPPSRDPALRARTPLFLPDEDEEREGSVMPSTRTLPPVPLFNEQPGLESDEEDNGMLRFSQVMNSYSNLPAGMVEDDDELDGAVFFGDADEVKELYD
ncbi:hypothetical protein MKEN_00080300 [Mycena kentingensis (nom. inval.)]|nr:hypothetical protein MKEN_00080300 [Mycena kentingensis (nom. inval.)]